MSNSINKTSTKVKIQSVKTQIQLIEAKIEKHYQNSFNHPERLLTEKLALSEIITILKNIEMLGTHDPAIIRKADNQTFQ